jgi:hypothetical protein
VGGEGAADASGVSDADGGGTGGGKAGGRAAVSYAAFVSPL